MSNPLWKVGMFTRADGPRPHAGLYEIVASEAREHDRQAILVGYSQGGLVARFLAWVAVYEWRLAYYWLVEHLAPFAAELRVGGKLSWIRTAREWVQRRIRQLGAQAFEGL